MKNHKSLIAFGVIILMTLLASACSIKVVEPGHESVRVLFGNASDPYTPGFHVNPANIFASWNDFDCRQKELTFENIGLTTQDQLQSKGDVTIKYRAIAGKTAEVFTETGTLEQAVSTHLVPKARSLLREHSKAVAKAEELVGSSLVQEQLQVAVENDLALEMETVGLRVQAVLLRNVTPPGFITKAIEAKKTREQEVERERAELERFKLEADKKIAQSESDKEAAENKAAEIRTLAQAEADKIELINRAMSSNPAYLQLKAMETLSDMSKDPAAKIYFLDGSSPSPLPLMHLGETK